MLQISIPAGERWDNSKQEFVYCKECTLQLEHSLVSISKWEMKWHKPFLSDKDKTDEEMLDYIRCMTITQNVNPFVYNFLTNDNIRQINEYINDPMSAMTSSKDKKKGKQNSEPVTAETIYWWIATLNIPLEAQKWHLNRLLALVGLFNQKNEPPKRMSNRERAELWAKVNEERKKKLNTKG